MLICCDSTKTIKQSIFRCTKKETGQKEKEMNIDICAHTPYSIDFLFISEIYLISIGRWITYNWVLIFNSMRLRRLGMTLLKRL